MTFRNFQKNRKPSKPRVSTIVYRILLEQKNKGLLKGVTFYSEDKFFVRKACPDGTFRTKTTTLVLVVGNKKPHQIKNGDDYLFIPRGQRLFIEALRKPV